MGRRRSILLALGTLATASYCWAAGDIPPQVGNLPPPIPLPKAALPKKPILPVIGNPSGADAVRGRNVVHISSGANEVIYISSIMPNRIATPFATPVVVDNGDEEFSHRVIGQDIYLTWTKKAPLGMFIYDANKPTGSVASLTLVPQEIPGQNIVLMLDQPAPSVARGEEAARATPTDYQDELRIALRALAMGVEPPGYAEGQITSGVVRVGALSLVPERQYAGAKMVLYRYRVENASKDTVELTEPSFADVGVRAVAFWPLVRLEPGDATHVLIAADYPLGGAATGIGSE